MPGAVSITVPGAPVGKGRARMTRAGHAYTPPKTRSYEALIALAAQQAMQGRPPMAGALTVGFTAYVPIAPSWPKRKQEAARNRTLRPTKKPDLDNYIKAAFDGMTGIVFVDDAQVVEMERPAKFYSDMPRLEITVQEIEG